MNRLTNPRVSRAFTLAEMMLTLGLVALVYTMMTGILVQISRYVRTGRVVASERLELLNTVEEIRYQLRSLFYPEATIALLGEPGITEGRDQLRFTTARGQIHRGVVEAGYQVQKFNDPKDPEKSAPALYYREFPFHRRELRPLTPHQEAQWKPLLKNVDQFQVRYFDGKANWSRLWDKSTSPSRVRIHIRRGNKSKDRIVFETTPGVGAKRW